MSETSRKQLPHWLPYTNTIKIFNDTYLAICSITDILIISDSNATICNLRDIATYNNQITTIGICVRHSYLLVGTHKGDVLVMALSNKHQLINKL